MKQQQSLKTISDSPKLEQSKCLIVNKLHFYPYNRCKYCEFKLHQCFGGFKAPIIILFIMMLLVIIRETNQPIISAASMFIVILLLVLLVSFSNKESTKLTINNYNLKRIQNSLSFSEEKYHSLFSSLPGGSFTVNYKYIITDVNDVVCKITGYTKEELINQPCNIICPKGPHKCPIFDLGKEKIDNDETAVKTKDLRFIPIIKSACKMTVRNSDFIVENFQDITEAKKVEEQLTLSLKEKHVLLQEIHHRVKNNLQIISSLLNLQLGHSEGKKIDEIFKECQNRIRTMALIHEKLYQSKDLTKIDFSEYIQNLTTFLFRSYNTANIALNIKVDNVMLSVDKAIPCGLIINELVTNSLKHAFPLKKLKHDIPVNKDEISISIYPENNNQYLLTIKDNGVGFPDNIDHTNTKTLGLQLVNMLTHQLKGQIELDKSNGTNFNIYLNK